MEAPDVPVVPAPTSPEEMFGIATAPPTPVTSSAAAAKSTSASAESIEDVSNALLPPDLPVDPPPMPSQTPASSLSETEGGKDAGDEKDGDSGECELLGPFALIIQGALGGLAILSLVYKRWRETPRRPVLIWFFDVSKQVFGSVLLHIMNVFFSMLSGGSFDVAKAVKPSTVSLLVRDGEFVQDDSVAKPNPCSFYLLNLAIDVSSDLSTRSDKITDPLAR